VRGETLPTAKETTVTDMLKFDVEDGVGWIVLNRPEARNAMNADMREAYLAALARCGDDPEIRAVVLTATGKGFCTGADLSGSRAATGASGPAHPGATRAAMQPSQRVIRALWDLEKPIIAGVNGVAAGLGAHLAYACDLVIASEEARFIEVFVRRGIALDAGGGFLLPRHVGLHKAKELVFLGDELSAGDAERLGLVNKVVPPGELEATLRAWAKRLAEGPTFAIGLSKRLLNRSLQADMDTLFAEEAFSQALAANSEDMREGIRSFVEKRPPAFKGR
jgi:2-(1,2-epoxy-1,2-dihydrophenyl)acetyl-CoA isomerase